MSGDELVVDASVVFGLVLDPGPRADRAAARVAASRPHAPDHLPVEVMNMLRRRRNAGLLTDSAANTCRARFWLLPITLWPLVVIQERTWRLGATLSSYDAAYVALAERLGAPLLTADAKLARAPGTACTFELIS